jgi:hypothetical protein
MNSRWNRGCGQNGVRGSAFTPSKMRLKRNSTRSKSGAVVAVELQPRSWMIDVAIARRWSVSFSRKRTYMMRADIKHPSIMNGGSMMRSATG